MPGAVDYGGYHTPEMTPNKRNGGKQETQTPGIQEQHSNSFLPRSLFRIAQVQTTKSGPRMMLIEIKSISFFFSFCCRLTPGVRSVLLGSIRRGAPDDRKRRMPGTSRCFPHVAQIAIDDSQKVLGYSSTIGEIAPSLRFISSSARIIRAISSA